MIYPNVDTVKEWARKNNIDADSDLKSIIERPEFNKQVLDEITAKAKENHLTGLERIRKVHIIDYPFKVENDLMTPTFKIKRNVAQKIF